MLLFEMRLCDGGLLTCRRPAPTPATYHCITCSVSIRTDDDMEYVYASHDTPMIWIICKEEEKDRELLQWIFAMTRDVQQQPTFHYKLITWYSNSLHLHLLNLSTSIVIYDFHLFDLVLARASSSLSLSVYNFLMWICHNSTKSFH